MSEAKADTVPGLGFKDKEKALETLKCLEGRDPDYQKLAIKGLIGRAKRTLTLTKDKDKLQNINEAVEIFEKWLTDFEINNRSKENRSYLPLTTVKTLLPLKEQFGLENAKADAFLDAYKSAGGEYKNLRTVSSDEDDQTWDIVRNRAIKDILKRFEEIKPDFWKDDLPTKEHMELIVWAYSPDASRIKKNLSKFEQKLGKEESEEDEQPKKADKRKSSGSSGSEEDEQPKKADKRKSSGSSGSEEESPKKKKK